MLTSITITVLVVAALGYGLRSERDGQLILHRRYNNRYNDAAGAREDHFE
jgi:hypothetical protein